MTNQDIQLVQQSWRKIEPVRRVTAELFYLKLAELDPALKVFFDDDLHASCGKFLQLADATVRSLDREVLLGAVRHLGLRNPTFGMSDQHHGSVAAALLWVLGKALRRDFTAEVKSAWIKAFAVLSQAMRTAAAPAAQAA
jgi:hemoglobin-like flavoprotein